MYGYLHQFTYMPSCKNIGKIHTHLISIYGTRNRWEGGDAGVIFLYCSLWEFYKRNVFIYICIVEKNCLEA